MSDHEIADLLHRAGSDLEPDVERLVAGGLARGRARRRRRRTAAATLALAVVTAGTTAALTLGSVERTDSDRFVDPVPTSPSPAPPAPSEDRGPGGEDPTSADPGLRYTAAPRQLAVTAAQAPATFAALVPGDVRLSETRDGTIDGFEPRDLSGGGDFPGEPPPGFLADITYDGFAGRVAVSPTDPTAGDGPLQRCRSAGGVGECVPQPGGGVLQQSTSTGPRVDGGITTTFVDFFTADKWVVTAMMSNAPDAGGEPSGGAPPLTEDQLVEVATSERWFR